MDEFKYEIVFSFCSEDESLASELNNLLQDRYSTFIYSEHQKQLAGKDGEIEFNKVFEYKARVVVIFYRNKWGKTPWTRIEENAIRKRAFKNGYDFTLFIPTEKKINMPDWLPKQRLYLSLERYGLEGAASAIELKIQENDGSTKEENAKERATRLKRKIVFENGKKLFLDSLSGVEAAKNELQKLFTIIEQIAEASTDRDKRIDLVFTIHRNEDSCSFFNNNFKMKLNWICKGYNSLDDCYLHAVLTKPMRNPHNPIIYSQEEFVFDKKEPKSYGWSSKNNKFYSTNNLANYLFKLLLEKIDNELNRNV